MKDDRPATEVVLNDHMLIVEDLMLLLLDDEKGSVAGEQALSYILGGALLVELALLGRIEQSDRKSRLSGRKVVVTGEGPLPDVLLQEAYDIIAEKARGAQSILRRIGGGLHQAVPDRLIERGMVRRERGKLLWVIPRTLHPAVDTSREVEVRRTMRAVLSGQEPADPRTAALISLLSASGTLKASLKDMDPPLPWSHDMTERAKHLQKSHWGASAVGDMVTAIAAGAGASGAASATAAITS